MTDELLRISGISAGTEDKPILHDINLTIGFGETHVLMGPNGAGKSTLGRVVMGDPTYSATSGTILFDNQDITDFSPDKRSLAGIFLSYQSPVEIPGVPLYSFYVPLRKCVRSSKQPRAISVSASEKFPTGLSLTRAS